MDLAEARRQAIAAVTNGAAPRPRRVTINGLDLSCIEWGDSARDPVLLLHGAGAHAHWWDALVPALATEHRLIAPDLRGHGESVWAVPPSYGIEDFGGDMLGVLDALAIERVALVGHSMGGRVALWLAAHHPGRVRALALLDVRVRGLKRERVDRWRGTSATDRPPRTYAAAEEAVASFRLTPAEPGIAPLLLRNLAVHAVSERQPGAWSLSFDRGVLGLDGSRLSDFGDLLPQVRCPAFVMKGADSTVIGDEQAEETARSLGAGEVEVFPGGHHFLLAAPIAVGGSLQRFFARRDAQA